MIECPCYGCEKRSQRCRVDCSDWKEYEVKAQEDKEKLRAYNTKYMYSARVANRNSYLNEQRRKKGFG